MKRQAIHILSLVLVMALCANTNNSLLSQTKYDQSQCDKANIEDYPESLWRLLMNFSDNKLIGIVDSILDVHSELVCPDLLRIESHKGHAYEHIFKFELAIETYDDILKRAQLYDFKDEEINILISLARVYEAIGKPEICLEKLIEAEKLLLNHDNEFELSHYYVRIASYHRIYDDKLKAEEYAQKAIDLGKKSGRLNSLSGGHLILGILNENIDTSINYFEKAAEYCYEDGDYVGYLFQKLNIARNYRDKGDYKTALEVIKSVEPEIPQFVENDKNYFQVKQYYSSTKASIYEIVGPKDSLISALKDINKYSNLFGDYVNQEKVNLLIFENELEEEKQKIAAQKKLVRLLSIGIISLFITIILLLRLFLQNKKKRVLIQDQRSTIESQYSELEKLYNYQSTLLSEVHHRIKNNLQLIISLLTLQKAKLGGEVNEDVLDMLSYRISSISLIHEQLYNLKEFENVDVGLYVSDLVNNFKSLIQDKNITIDYQVGDIKLNLETIIPLGLVWSELISNSIKYNHERGHLRIYFELNEFEEGYVMNYRDDGKGYPDGKFSSNTKGMGYTIISSLTRQLSADTDSYNDNGAHYKMTFIQKKISPL